MTTSVNASPTVFGWQFQFAAAIYHFLRNIEHVDSIRVEGKNEDFELTMDDGSIIYGQAKAIGIEQEAKQSKNRLKDALRSLNRTFIAHCKKQNKNKYLLIYCTNSSTPFNKDDYRRDFDYKTVQKKYSELREEHKSILADIKKKKNYYYLNTRLEISVIAFEDISDIKAKYSTIQSIIDDFLSVIDINTSFIANKYLKYLQITFFNNATQRDTSLELSKKDLVWPIIVYTTPTCSKDIELNADACEIEIIEEKYKDIIEENSNRLDLFSRVISTYMKFRENYKGRNHIADFTNNHSTQFEDEFDNVSIDENLKSQLVTLIVNSILYKWSTINKIKKAANL